MKHKQTRRDFIRTSGIAAIGIGITGSNSFPLNNFPVHKNHSYTAINTDISLPFVPIRAASWWCTLEDILWPQKKITDKIKRRAEAFSNAGIDTAINFGFHIRFDFSNYFGQLHGYYVNVCEELHKYDIKFLDHYSCNHVERPRGADEFRKLHRGQRHHILLFHDPVAAKHAQYEGYLFDDLCEVDIRDGSRGYARQYQMEVFCHNNPEFLGMHKKYLLRLVKEVPLDGMEVDDMCDYAGLTTCGCVHCRERFRRDYGHEIPPFNDSNFWGDTSRSMLLWGNYDNPVFRDWIKMKADSVADHVRMVKNLLNRSLAAVPHPTLKDIPGNPILKDIESEIKDNHLAYKVNTGKLKLTDLSVRSPELGNEPRHADMVDSEKGYSTLQINLDGIKIYAVLK